MDFVNEAASSNNVEMITSLGTSCYQNNATTQKLDVKFPSEIDPYLLLNAAADGNVEPFKLNSQQLNLIVTPIKNTVLHINISSEKASTEFVESILGLCPSLLLQVNAQGDTPLHVAAKFEHVAVVEALIKHAKSQHVEQLESGIGAAGQMLRMTNNKGNTALHEAARNQLVDVVGVLVDEDTEFLYPANKCGETPLYIAAETGFLGGVVKMLTTCSSATHEGPNGKTALHAAVRRNYLGLTRNILEKKKSLTKGKDDNGWTPLHCAAYYGRFRVTRILLEFDKSVAYIADNCKQMTPLHLAASQGHIDIVREIILFCPDCYELVDDRGWNFLHFAMATLSKNDLSSLVENLLIKKLVHEKDAKGNTPLHVLATCTSSMCALDFFEDIVDQVRGDRGAVNRQNFNVAETFNYGCPELQQEILALSTCTDFGPNVGPYARGVIHIQGKRYDEYLLQIKGAKESHLVAAALIATVTFAAAFTLPGGYKCEEGKNQGTAMLSRKSAFQSFVITDAIAMVFSISAVFIYFIMSVERFKNYWYLFELGAWFTVVAMGAMVIAFVTGTYAVLAPSLWLAIVICFIGLSFFLLLLPVGFSIILDLIKGKPQWNSKMKYIENYLKLKLLSRRL